MVLNLYQYHRYTISPLIANVEWAYCFEDSKDIYENHINPIWILCFLLEQTL